MAGPIAPSKFKNAQEKVRKIPKISPSKYKPLKPVTQKLSVKSPPQI